MAMMLSSCCSSVDVLTTSSLLCSVFATISSALLCILLTSVDMADRAKRNESIISLPLTLLVVLVTSVEDRGKDSREISDIRHQTLNRDRQQPVHCIHSHTNVRAIATGKKEGVRGREVGYEGICMKSMTCESVLRL
jgi:hypothetical protein